MLNSHSPDFGPPRLDRLQPVRIEIFFHSESSALPFLLIPHYLSSPPELTLCATPAITISGERDQFHPGKDGYNNSRAGSFPDRAHALSLAYRSSRSHLQ